MYFIEFRNFRTQNLLDQLEKLRAANHEKYRWVQWLPEMEEILSQPDLTLIYSKHLDCGQLLQQTNDSKGRFIVLIGDGEPMLGLQILPQDFRMHDLFLFLQEAESPDMAPAEFLERLNYKSTVPLWLASN